MRAKNNAEKATLLAKLVMVASINKRINSKRSFQLLDKSKQFPLGAAGADEQMEQMFSFIIGQKLAAGRQLQAINL